MFTSESATNLNRALDVAWTVNLAKPLDKFEDCLQGLRNLIDLALHSPQITRTKILFVSTMSVVRSMCRDRLVSKENAHFYHIEYPELSAPEEHFWDPSPSIGFGYSESKWVAEQMLHHANQSTGLPVTSVRVSWSSLWRPKRALGNQRHMALGGEISARAEMSPGRSKSPLS